MNLIQRFLLHHVLLVWFDQYHKVDKVSQC